MKLFMRIFATCKNAQSVNEISASIIDKLRVFSPELFSEPKQYWKNPNLFEFTFTIAPADQETFRLIVAFCKIGWTHMDSEIDISSVWNRSKNNIFLVPIIEWAEVSLNE